MKLREFFAWLAAALLLIVVVSGGAMALNSARLGDWPDFLVAWKDGTPVKYVPVGISPPTATPIPTNTPRPTFTPSPTPLPASATPTQEVATWTPQPTTTPPARCWVKNNSNFRTNLRREPRIANNIVGWVGRGEVVALQEVMSSTSYVWAKTTINGKTGWFVIWGGNWWVYSLGAETQACLDIPGWPGDELPPEINPPPPTPTRTATPPPRTRAALLWHDVPGGNVQEMRQAWAVLKSEGVPFGVKAVSDPAACNAAQAAGGICIFRSVHPADCPDVTNPDPRREAYLYMLSVAPYYNQNIRPDYLELVNECNMDNLAWWRDFMLEAVRLQRAWNWPPLAMPSLIPGAGDSTLIGPLVPALRALQDAGGCFSSHDYGIYNSHLIAPDGACDVWTSCRHRLIRAALNRYGLQGLPICVTEAARGSGNEPVDVQDFAQWYGAVAPDAGLHSVAFWTAGHTGAWPNANLNGHMVQIAQAVH